jgi:hypothetical protein
MPGCQGARVRGCQGARVPGCEGARVRSLKSECSKCTVVGFRVKAQGVGFQVPGFIKVQGYRFWGQGSRLKVEGSRVKGQG